MQKKTNNKSSFLHTSYFRLQGGFTIIEMLVAISIFTLIVGSTIGLLVSAIRSQVKILTTQKLLDETSYALEYMGRFLRMAKRDEDATCIGPSDPVADLTRYNYKSAWDGFMSGYGIRFLDYRERCHQFGLHEDFDLEYLQKIGEWQSDNEKMGSGWNIYDESSPHNHITSKDYTLNMFEDSPRFFIQGGSGADRLQPRVTISLLLKKGPHPGSNPQIRIQTTISQRNLDL
jgi:prepilin-type N-terminal cleavage/methylation domain-containing protein